MNRYLLVALILLSVACGVDRSLRPMAVPANAVQFTPAQLESSALDSAVACLNRTATKIDHPAFNVTDVTWYAVQGLDFPYSTGTPLQGYAGGAWIAIAVPGRESRFMTTEHEILHKLVNDDSHQLPFWFKCGIMNASASVYFVP